MPRLVRRRPLLERLKAYLNPLDFLLWLSEEIETRDWDDQSFANPLGAALNFIFLLARANSGPSRSTSTRDDIFGDSSGSGWFSWFVSDYFISPLSQPPLTSVEVCLHCSLTILAMRRECCLYIPSKTPLPFVRKPHGQYSWHSFCTSGAS
jgi:hypothetical protein